MAKVPSPFLTGATGKFAGAAFQQSPGNGTILREVVKPTNPSTEAQVEQRAKFKLMSQVATAFKSVIAMKREGNITPRNMFVKINSPLLTFDSAAKQAKIDLLALQLTKGTQQVSATATFKGKIVATLTSGLPNLIGAIFVVVSKTADGSIEIKAVATKKVEDPTDSITHEFQDGLAGPFVLAYGITKDAGDITIKYGNAEYKSPNEGILSVLSNLAELSALTKTAGVKMQ